MVISWRVKEKAKKSARCPERLTLEAGIDLYVSRLITSNEREQSTVQQAEEWPPDKLIPRGEVVDVTQHGNLDLCIEQGQHNRPMLFLKEQTLLALIALPHLFSPINFFLSPLITFLDNLFLLYSALWTHHTNTLQQWTRMWKHQHLSPAVLSTSTPPLLCH